MLIRNGYFYLRVSCISIGLVDIVLVIARRCERAEQLDNNFPAPSRISLPLSLSLSLFVSLSSRCVASFAVPKTCCPAFWTPVFTRFSYKRPRAGCRQQALPREFSQSILFMKVPATSSAPTIPEILRK